MESTKKEALEKAYNRLSQIEEAMRGLGAMFTVTNHQLPLEGEELYGLGCLLQIISRETSRVEQFLRCGEIQNDLAPAPDDDDDDDDDDDEKK